MIWLKQTTDAHEALPLMISCSLSFMIDLGETTNVCEALQLAPTPLSYLQLLVFRENAKESQIYV